MAIVIIITIILVIYINNVIIVYNDNMIIILIMIESKVKNEMKNKFKKEQIKFYVVLRVLKEVVPDLEQFFLCPGNLLFWTSMTSASWTISLLSARHYATNHCYLMARSFKLCKNNFKIEVYGPLSRFWVDFFYWSVLSRLHLFKYRSAARWASGEWAQSTLPLLVLRLHGGGSPHIFSQVNPPLSSSCCQQERCSLWPLIPSKGQHPPFFTWPHALGVGLSTPWLVQTRHAIPSPFPVGGFCAQTCYTILTNDMWWEHTSREVLGMTSSLLKMWMKNRSLVSVFRHYHA